MDATKNKNNRGRNIHEWNVSISEARKIQEKLRSELQQKPLPPSKNIRYIAGADVSFNKFEKDVYAGIIVFEYKTLQPVAHAVMKMEVNFPYVPGFLSFREIPPLLKVWEELKKQLAKENLPDIIVVDGHGIAHPRRLGIAAHLGLVIDRPTMGVAKNILYGVFDEPENTAGSFSYIFDPKNNNASEKTDEKEKIGVVLRTKNNVKPVFVSPGHLCTIDDALRIAKETTRKHRLPEPTRLAHELVNEFRRSGGDSFLAVNC